MYIFNFYSHTVAYADEVLLAHTLLVLYLGCHGRYEGAMGEYDEVLLAHTLLVEQLQLLSLSKPLTECIMSQTLLVLIITSCEVSNQPRAVLRRGFCIVLGIADQHLLVSL